jgi:hypothetical protein
MITAHQQKIIIRIIISLGIITLYVLLGKQLVVPDPKGLGFFFLIFAGFIFSSVVGVFLTIVALTGKRNWIRSWLFILTAFSNSAMLIICLGKTPYNVVVGFLCYLIALVGLVQLYLLLRDSLRKDTFS